MAEPQLSEAPHPPPGPPAYGCPDSSKGAPPHSSPDNPHHLLFKFPQMDFEMAIWEMTHLIIAPKKVFRSIYYHLSGSETKNTYHLADPSFTYLLSLFQLLTGLAWGIPSTTSISGTVRLTLIFIFIHFLLGSLVVATASYFLVGRLLGPRRRRRRGLFGDVWGGEGREGDRESGGVDEGLEFGYCFDVSEDSQPGKRGAPSGVLGKRKKEKGKKG
ncbi:MAG: hypothetical protein Q9208_002853 [Pyrenodesmia sp. 3 TL-2023]